jgi:hyperosmotically inducible protein
MVWTITARHPPAPVMAAAVVVLLAVLLLTSGPLGAAEMDHRIQSSFEKTFVYKTYLQGDHITINSEYGAVILSGTVADETHSLLAQDTAAALPGVSSVNNRIAVTGDRLTANSDPWLRLKVRAALLFHRSINSTKTEVTVNEGIVTLTGEASTQAEKELTIEYAKDVEGVKGIKDGIRVAASSIQPDQTWSKKMDDASITAQVKMTLAAHRSTSGLNIKVTTRDGIVTLRGEARNAAEKDLVTKQAMDIDGVRRVVNNMTIEATVSSNK